MAIIGNGVSQAVVKRHARRPAGSSSERRIVGDEVADVDMFPVNRKVLDDKAALHLSQKEFGKLTQRGGRAAHVKYAAARRRLRGSEKGLSNIFAEAKIALLVSAPYLERLTLQQEAYPSADEGLPSRPLCACEDHSNW